LHQERISPSGGYVTSGDRGNDRELRERNYPDILAAGSLAAVLSDALVRQGSRLSIGREFFGAQSATFASCWHGDRGVQMYIAKYERLFSMGLWEKDIEVAHAKTPDIDEAARTIRCWLEDPVELSAVEAELPHVRLNEKGMSYARGTYLEDEWRRLIERTRDSKHSEYFHWDDLASLIRLASQHPELRRFQPFTSLWRFSVSAKAGIPAPNIPLVWPLGDGLFRLGDDEPIQGDAEAMVEALATYVREHGIEPRGFDPSNVQDDDSLA
jgi:hypothetical protein